MKRILHLFYILIYFIHLSHELKAQEVNFRLIQNNLGLNETSGLMGFAWADYNGDGYLDLLLCGSPTVLYKNNIKNTSSNDTVRFELVSAKTPTERGKIFFDVGGLTTNGAVAGDFNNDGKIDFVVSERVYIQDADTFKLSQRLLTSNDASGIWGLTTGDFDRDGDLDIAFAAGTGPNQMGPMRIFVNDGNANFTDAAAQLGVDNFQYEAWNPVWVDIDNDGYLDLWMPDIRTVEPCALFLNNLGQELIYYGGEESGIVAQSAIVSSWADFNNDGYQDLFLIPFSGDNDGNAKLFMNNGNRTFTDVAPAIGLDSTYVNTRGASWGDYDNDGYLDLLLGIRARQDQQLWHNNGDGTFTLVSDLLGLNQIIVSDIRSVTFVDYDNDGWLDIYIMQNGTNRPFLLHNEGGNGNNWVKFIPKGVTNNRAGIGTRIIAVTGNLRMTRIIQTADAGGTNGQIEAHFGLGKNNKIDSLYVYWPNGVVDISTNIPANKQYILEEGKQISGFNGAINTNGSFEDATLGPVVESDVSGWTLYAAGGAQAYFEIVDDPVVDGTKALMAITDVLGSNAWDIQVVNEPFAVKPNTKYTYSIWAKADEEGPVVNFTVGEPGTYREWGRAHQVVMTTEWQKIQFEFTTPDGVTEGRAPIHLSESINSGFVPIVYYFDDLRIIEGTVNVEEELQKPLSYQLSQNYPNPFNPETTIEFSLPEPAKVRLLLYDILGREIKTLASGNYNTGKYNVKLNAKDLSSGVYFYRLEANNFTAVKKLVLLR